MPTYEYKCDNCGHEFEIHQSMKDDKLTKCPVCKKETLKRLIGGGGGLIFKGSGFYLTDYKNKPSETSASANTGAKDTASVKTDTKSETPATSSSETKSKSSSNTETKSKKSDVKSSSSKAEK